MYFEEAEVKEYERKNKTKYKQIHLGTGSNFKKSEKVAVVNFNDFEILISKPKLEDEIETLEATVEELTSDKNKLENELDEFKKKYENLKKESDLKIEDANKNIIDAKDKILEIQQEKEKVTNSKDDEIKKLNSKLNAEIKELNSKLNDEKDFTKKLLAVINVKDNDIVYLANRSLGKRIINRLPERIKAIVEKSSEDVDIDLDKE